MPRGFTALAAWMHLRDHPSRFFIARIRAGGAGSKVQLSGAAAGKLCNTWIAAILIVRRSHTALLFYTEQDGIVLNEALRRTHQPRSLPSRSLADVKQPGISAPLPGRARKEKSGGTTR